MALREGQIYPAQITGYSSDGAGIARIDGMAVFVRDSVRGEVAEVLIEYIGHNAALGRTSAILQPSPARREPDCIYYGQCGGCQFRHMSYQEELKAKRLRVQDALARIGGTPLSVEVIHGATDTSRYRNKVQLPVGQNAIGYYARRTHRVVDIHDCLLQPESDCACQTALRSWMAQYQVPAYDKRSGQGLVRHLFLRTNQAGETLCCVVANGRSLPHERELTEMLREAVPGLVGVVLSVNRAKTNVILGRKFRTLWGQNWLEEALLGKVFRLSLPSFFQVNQPQCEVLYRRVLDFAALTGKELVVDLYCGIGSISLCLAEQAGQVVGVEMIPQAVADAMENARRNGLSQKTHFQCGDAARLSAQFRQEGIRPQVVVVDPPRKGLAPEVVDAIAGMGPDRVVYVSCDPATLARDVKRFSALGYQAQRAEAVDLFPRTAHVETVVLLQRGSS